MLPNLKTFKFRSSSPTPETAFLFFLGPSIRKLEIPWGGEFQNSYFTYIHTRSPHLEELTLGPEATGAHLEACLEGLPSLQRLSCYPSDDAAIVFRTCCGLPTLARLYLRVRWDTQGAILHFEEGGFQKLWNLKLRMSIEDWITLLDGGNLPPLLGSLTIEGVSTQGENGGAAVQKLFETIAKKVPKIKDLTLRQALSSNPPVTFAQVKPLLSCKGLTKIDIQNPRGVAVSIDHVDQILGALPRLAILRLTYDVLPRAVNGNSAKAEWTAPTLPITVLDNCAANHPQITSLALCVHGEIPNLAQLLSKNAKLPNLKTLDLTFSSATRPHEVALYLAERVPANLSLAWKEYRAVDSPAFRQAEIQWKEVAAIFGVLQQQRAILEGRFNGEITRLRNELEAEIRSLRDQLSKPRSSLQRDIFGRSMS